MIKASDAAMANSRRGRMRGCDPQGSPVHGRLNALRQTRRCLKIEGAILDRGPYRLKTREGLRAGRAFLEVLFDLQALHQIKLAIDIAVDECLCFSAVQVTTLNPRSRPAVDAAARGHGPGGT